MEEDDAIVDPELHSFHITNMFLFTQNFARISQRLVKVCLKWMDAHKMTPSFLLSQC